MKFERDGAKKANCIDPELLGLLGFEGEDALPTRSAGAVKRSPDLVELRSDSHRVQEEYRACMVCAERCGANRYVKPGVCGNDDRAHVYAGQVSGCEETLISPTFEILFSGCNLVCRDCHQSAQWPFRRDGMYLSDEDVIAGILRQRDKVTSISFLGGNPEQSLAGALALLLKMESAGIGLPYVFNSNFMFEERYSRVIEKYFDVLLPDFKFGNDACASVLAGSRVYVDIVKRNILCVRSSNPIIIRHRPRRGHWDCCTKPILEWVAEHAENGRLALECLESLFNDNIPELDNMRRYAHSIRLPIIE